MLLNLIYYLQVLPKDSFIFYQTATFQEVTEVSPDIPLKERYQMTGILSFHRSPEWKGGSRGNLGWNFQPGIPRTPVVETLSCGRKGSLRKGGNLLRQARPPGLRAFPGLNGTLVPAPRESNFHNTSSGRGSSISELRTQTQYCQTFAPPTISSGWSCLGLWLSGVGFRLGPWCPSSWCGQFCSPFSSK